MSDIKSVIVNLCKYINLLLDEDFRPEYFRLAKFNKADDNVISLFWNILYKLIPESSTNDSLSIVNCVKLYFASFKYESLDFYALPEDESSGSRELLLAFGYLIGEHDILDSILHSIITKSLLNSEFPDIRTERNVSANEIKCETEQEVISNTMWLIGKINNNLKSISEYDSQTIKLVDKVHKISKNVSGLPHLSINDIYSVKHSEYAFKYMEECRRITNILETKAKWAKTNRLFWEWMGSVLVEKENQAVACNLDSTGTTLELFYNILSTESNSSKVVNFSDTGSIFSRASNGKLEIATNTFGTRSVHFPENFHSSNSMHRCIQLNAKQSYQATKDSFAISPYLNSAQRQLKKAEMCENIQKRNASIQDEIASVDEIVGEQQRRVDRVVCDVQQQLNDALKQYGCQLMVD